MCMYICMGVHTTDISSKGYFDQTPSFDQDLLVVNKNNYHHPPPPKKKKKGGVGWEESFTFVSVLT